LSHRPWSGDVNRRLPREEKEFNKHKELKETKVEEEEKEEERRRKGRGRGVASWLGGSEKR
jgi:hypothetical protein